MKTFNRVLIKLHKLELKRTNPKQGQPKRIIWSNKLQ